MSISALYIRGCYPLLLLGFLHVGTIYGAEFTKEDESTTRTILLSSTNTKSTGENYPLFLPDDIFLNDIVPSNEPDEFDRNLFDLDDTLKLETKLSRSSLSIRPSPTDRAKKVWDVINNFASYKTSASYTDGTLTSMHYIILPTWWSNELPSDPSLAMDPSQIASIMDQNYDYYKEMSWGKVSVTYSILDQFQVDVSDVSPGFDDTTEATRNRVASLGYVAGEDYDGLVFVHSIPQKPPLAGGGWGNINANDPFMWMSYPMHYRVTRHEAGHNFGHPHHLSNSYEYRFNRPQLKETVMPYDGYDMMSGGNGGDRAKGHLAAASKWFFNWIPDEAIVVMQPEGSTSECPSCHKSGTFVINRFDDPSFKPSVDTVMAVHIPIAVVNNRVYSYWLSYRSDPLTQVGLSIHLSWFYNLGGNFGAAYDSLNYDAYGDTFTREDSFVTVNTCYVVNPSAYMKDIDFESAVAIQPVVCVNSIDEGNNITVSVEFLDTKESSTLADDINPLNIQCSQTGNEENMSLDLTNPTLLHVKNTGQDGIVSLSFCPQTGDLNLVTKCYIFDDYPTAPINYDSEPSYGSFKSLTRRDVDCCEPGMIFSVTSARVVKVTNNASGREFIHLNEIEIYDSNGVNVALNGKCFSSSSEYGGVSSCLNDGLTGTFPETCRSHSGYEENSFDFCVLEEFTDIQEIKVFPMVDPAGLWSLDRLRDLKVEVFAFALGLDDVDDPNNVGTDSVKFHGLMESFSLVDVFNRTNSSPKTLTVTLEETSVACPVDGNPTPLTYKTVHGSAWIYIPPVPSDSESSLSLSCSVSSCRVNEYMHSDAYCQTCPDMKIAPAGSTSVDACNSCLDGSSKSLNSPDCVLSEVYKPLISSKGWRIWAPSFHTVSGYSWDVRRLEFYEDENCEVLIDPVGTPIDSGNAASGWGPSNVFDGGGLGWGGRFDDNDKAWIGMEFDSEIKVKCLRFTNGPSWAKSVTEMRVQAYEESKDKWVNVMIFKMVDTSADAINVVSPRSFVKKLILKKILPLQSVNDDLEEAVVNLQTKHVELEAQINNLQLAIDDLN